MSENSGTPERRRRGRPAGSRDSKPRKARKSARSGERFVRRPAYEAPQPRPLPEALSAEHGEQTPQAFRSDIKKALVLAALREGRSITSACATATCSRSSFHAWRKEDPDFSEAVETALEEGIERVEDAFFEDAMKPGAWVAKLAYLKGVNPSKWREGGNQVTVNVGPKPGADFEEFFSKFETKVRESALEAERARIDAVRQGAIEPSGRHGSVVDI